MLHSYVDFRLLVITNSQICNVNFIKRISNLSDYGIKAIQLREKKFSSKEFLTLAKKVKSKIKFNNTKLFINDRLDIALLADADGIHSPSKGINAKYIKPFMANYINGKSVHTLIDAKKAEEDGFDYILYGPVYCTPDKMQYGRPMGLKKLEKVCSAINIPVFAVGGIEPQNSKNCLESGAYGVAAIRPFMIGKNIKKIIDNFHKSLGEI